MLERYATLAMGTRFELVLASPAADDNDDAAAAARRRAIAEAALDEIDGWHARLSRFASDSVTSHVNRTAAQRAVKIDSELFQLIEYCLDVERASGGAFSVDAGATPHASAGVALDFLGKSVRFTHADAALDFGAIGKGHALECAAAILRSHGIERALLHGGTSSVIAIGAPPASAGWRVAITAASGAPVVTLRDAALSVSRQQADGHIIDRRTGAPAVPRTVAVTGPNARVAEAWSTAIVVLGACPSELPADLTVLIGEHDKWRMDGAAANVDDRVGLAEWD
ncbi:MAG: FAD:protein FMN transferase [Planctomycetota bacterium]